MKIHQNGTKYGKKQQLLGKYRLLSIFHWYNF